MFIWPLVPKFSTIRSQFSLSTGGGSHILSTKTDEARGAAAEKIASALQTEILSGMLLPGARLGEVALADRFAVSRGPVRAALNQLSESGLVSIVPNSCLLYTSPSPRD